MCPLYIVLYISFIYKAIYKDTYYFIRHLTFMDLYIIIEFKKTRLSETYA